VTSTPADLRHLDDGEREAIALAQTTGTTLILLDEKKGRQVARECGLSVAGTLGVIDLAARRGLISLFDALKNLERTSFRASPQLIRAIIENS
jgi:predicted nucleic acid-binding protein